MKEKIKFSIFWVLSFIVIIFMMTFKSYAEDVPNGDLPYNVPIMRGLNTCIPNEALEIAIPQIERTFREQYGQTENIRYLVFTSDGIINNAVYDILVIPNPTIHTEITENFNYRSNSISIHANGFQAFRVGVRVDLRDYSRNFNAGTSFNLLGNSSTLELNDGTFTSRYVLYMGGMDELKYNDIVVFTNEINIPPVIDIGVAIIPPDAITPVYPSGATPPSQVPPTYTTSDYSWTTPPTFDGSSVENALGSIQNLLGWLANNLKEEFKNLTNNLKGFFKYIGDTIQYYGNSILQTLNNFILNFYDNMKSLIEPIFQKIDYITTPLEADVIWDNISGTSLITNYSSIINAASFLKSSFENLSEPTEYKIPIHLENISTFGTLTTQYIDLSVINPVKTIIRTFMWALITYSLVVTIIDSIANYINGGGDES